MVPKGGLEPPRVASHAPQTCASASSATSAFKYKNDPRTTRNDRKRTVCVYDYFCGVPGDAVMVTEGLGDTAGVAAGVSVADGDATGVAVASSSVDCKTERVPVMPGRESVKAISINDAAATMVTFANTLAVPRGPNAALDTPPEKRSPALDLPGCNSTTTTSTTHDSMNSPYRM